MQDHDAHFIHIGEAFCLHNETKRANAQFYLDEQVVLSPD